MVPIKTLQIYLKSISNLFLPFTSQDIYLTILPKIFATQVLKLDQIFSHLIGYCFCKIFIQYNPYDLFDNPFSPK